MGSTNKYSILIHFYKTSNNLTEKKSISSSQKIFKFLNLNLFQLSLPRNQLQE